MNSFFHFLCHKIVFFSICQFFIKNFSEKGDIVLDPFCGRGTTVLEANQQNRIGLGVDVSPLALEIAKSKLKSIVLRFSAGK